MTNITTSPSMYSTSGWRANNDFVSCFKNVKHVAITSKEKAACFCMSMFRNNKRVKSDITSVVGVVFDFDDTSKTNYDQAVNILTEKNITSVVYTTFSAFINNNNERFRVVIPFDDIKEKPTQKWYASIHAKIAEDLGFENYDKTCNQRERLYFFPSKPVNVADGRHRVAFIEGKNLSLDEYEKKKSKTIPQQGSQYIDIERDKLFILDNNNKPINIRSWWEFNNNAVRLADIIEINSPDIVISGRADKTGLHITCPYEEEHTTNTPKDKACFVDNPSEQHPFSTIHCLHEHCLNRDTPEFVWKLLKDKKITFEQIEESKNNILQFPGIEEDIIIKQTPETEIIDSVAALKENQLDDINDDDDINITVLEETVNDKKIISDLYRVSSLKDFMHIIKIENFDKHTNDEKVHYQLAFSAVDKNTLLGVLDEETTNKIIFLRNKLKDIKTYIKFLIEEFEYKSCLEEEIYIVSKQYDLSFDDAKSLFIEVRLEEIDARNFKFKNRIQKKAFFETIKMFDNYYRKINKSLLQKTPSTGTIYVDTRKFKNILIPMSGIYNEDTLNAEFGRLVGFDSASEEYINPVNLWLSLPKLEPSIEEVTCSPKNKIQRYIYNSYDTDFDIAPIKCDLDEFHNEELKPFFDILANGREESWRYILTWAAHTHIFRDKKLPTALFFMGKPGAGKSFLIRSLFVAPHGLFGLNISNRQHLLSNFNASLAGKHMVFYDEVAEQLDFKNDGDLKYLITNPILRIEPKGVDARVVDSFHHFVFASNNTNIVKLDENDRRLSYFRVNNKYMKDVRFWEALIPKLENPSFIARMKYFLLNFDNEKYGVGWDVVTRPLDNEERLRLLSAPVALFENYILEVIKNGKTDVSINIFGTFDCNSVELNWEKPTIIRASTMMAGFNIYLKEKNTTHVKNHGLLSEAHSLFMTKYILDNTATKEFENDSAVFGVFKPLKEIASSLVKNEVISKYEYQRLVENIKRKKIG